MCRGLRLPTSSANLRESEKTKFPEFVFPECFEDDYQALTTSTCQVAPSVSRARNRSSGVLPFWGARLSEHPQAKIGEVDASPQSGNKEQPRATSPRLTPEWLI